MRTKNFLLTLCLLCSFNMFAQFKNMTEFFDKYENEDNVTIVNISKAMFKMMPINSITTGNTDISSIVSKIESLRIITSENKDLKEKMAAETKKMVSKNRKYEELMRIKDDKSNIILNAVKNGSVINELLMLVSDKENFVAIQILGNFTVEDVQKITINKDNP